MSNQAEEQSIIKDMVNPYFKKKSNGEYDCTVYGPKEDIDKLRKLIKDEIGIDLPKDGESYTFITDK